ncbi:MAG: flagellar hook-associated protein FlgL [Synergistaceae bacterium]|nr:flagellar hook-associated protein FlgL [Synergistaceae bacterium]
MFSRMTTATMYGSLLSSLQNSMRNMQELQKQIATGNKYTKLSDNPTAISRALGIESALDANEQYQYNTQNAATMLKYSYSALNNVLNAAQTIRELIIQAGDGALDESQLKDINDQIEANKKIMLDNLNTRVAGQYIFGGTDTSTRPFTENSDGSITYTGTDQRIKYAVNDNLLGDVSFSGSDIVPRDEDSYFICSHYVPADWVWQGREEKVQITVGNRTLSVFIPEDWSDNDYNKTSTELANYTDYNGYRDPNEVTGITLDNLVTIINRSLQEQGASSLVNAYIERDSNTGMQQMIIKSNTGEKVGITGWPDTDYMPMPATVTSVDLSDINFTEDNGGLKGVMGNNNLVGWKGSEDSGELTITIKDDKGNTVKEETFNLADFTSSTALVDEINSKISGEGDGTPFASLTSGNLSGRLILQTSKGNIQVTGTDKSMQELFGVNESELTGTQDLSTWPTGFTSSDKLIITVDGTDYDIDLSTVSSLDELNDAIESAGITGLTASLTSDSYLKLEAKNGSFTVTGEGNALSELLGAGNDDTLNSEGVLNATSSTLTIKLNEQDSSTATIYINKEDTTETLADKINAIQGVFARTTADKNRIVISAQRTGDLPEDRLRINEAEEELHYPSLTIIGSGGAAQMFEEFDSNNALKAVSQRRIVDQSHIDVFDYLGMETAMKSREFSPTEKLKVKDGEQLHWRVISGGKAADIKLNAGEYTLQDIADRLKNAGAGWLEVSVSEDKNDNYGTGTLDSEALTQRLVIRGYNAEQVLFIDMNEYNYADKMGLSTALRTDGYVDGKGTGTRCVNFPSAPCVDDNIGIPMRVQMNCGMYYDVNIKRGDVVDPETGFVDRNKVMQAIVKSVNAQEGSEIMGCTIHVDKSGQEIKDSSAIYFLSGEAFTVVDMPFDDPVWNTYSGGIAAQMGIHGGVTSNLAKTPSPIKDSDTFGTSGTLRFSNLGHSVEIDVSESDTVKDVMDRLRTQAGDWLYVNYYDQHMGNTQDSAARNSGDYPLISFSSIDGSAVNILDVKGHIAQDTLGISTGIQTRIDDSDNDFMSDAMTWDVEGQSFPADRLVITVAGYSHTIDLTAMRDVTDDTVIKGDDLAAFISARMQDYDVRAEINEDNELMIWSERGYSVEVKFTDNVQNVTGSEDLSSGLSVGTEDTLTITVDGKDYKIANATLAAASSLDDLVDVINNAGIPGITASATDGKYLQIVSSGSSFTVTGEGSALANIFGASDKTLKSDFTDLTSNFLGNEPSSRTYYRGGYNLDGSADSRGITADELYNSGIHTQNATIRSGANTTRQNGFGVINDVMAAVKAGNTDALTDKLLPRIDNFINNILTVMSENGALQTRYEYNTDRLITENAIMTDEHDKLVTIDPADAISQLMVADYMYQANLAIISRLIQPSLLDFLS